MKPALLIAAAALAGLAAPEVLSAAESQPAPAAPAPRPYPQLTHVAWVVPDLDKALAASAAQLGTGPANLVFRRVLKVDRGIYRGRPARFSAEFALVELGNTQFEFIQPLTGTSPYSDALKGQSGAVLHHLAFTVPDLDKQIASARRANPEARVALDAHLAGFDARYVYMSGVMPGSLVEFIPGR